MNISEERGLSNCRELIKFYEQEIKKPLPLEGRGFQDKLAYNDFLEAKNLSALSLDSK